MTVVGQAGFGGGIWRLPDGPADGLYDAVNALIDDQGWVQKRGGGAIYSSTSGEALRGVFDAPLPATGTRTLLWSAVTLFALIGTVPQVIYPSIAVVDGARPAFVGPAVAVIAAGGTDYQRVWLWGGTFIYANAPGGGTLTVTSGQTQVVSTAGGWLSDPDAKPGMFVVTSGGTGVIKQVDDDTHLQLVTPWTGATASGLSYTLQSLISTNPVSVIANPPQHVTVAGNKLIVTSGTDAFVSAANAPTTFDVTDFHRIPGQILGAEGLGDRMMLFSTEGVYVVTGMSLDLTDADGNPQRRVDRVSQSIVLWGDPGIAGWTDQIGLTGAGRVIVPALDDVYLMGPAGETIPISQGIRPLYLSYVQAGYLPGLAAVYRGHYVLPIVDATRTTVIDVLVCRLTRRDRSGLAPAWTRLSGQVASVAYTQRIPAAGGAPSLFSIKVARVHDVSGVFTPAAANKLDADGSTFNLDVTTRDYDTGPGNLNTVRAVELDYELVDAASDNPTLAVSFSTGIEGAAFTSLATAPESDGTARGRWRLAKRARRVRLRVVSSGPSARLKLRALRVTVRASNRP